jgi:hypothetical protein
LTLVGPPDELTYFERDRVGGYEWGKQRLGRPHLRSSTLKNIVYRARVWDLYSNVILLGLNYQSVTSRTIWLSR